MTEKKHIVILNPNSSVEMSKAIETAAKIYAQDRVRVTVVTNAAAPDFIDYPEDVAIAALPMAETVKSYENDADAFVLACHCDPALRLLRQVSKKPVIGIGEASMRLAVMLGARFTIICTDPHSVTQKKELVHEYGMERYCASVVLREMGEGSETDAYERAARKAVQEDLAEVIVLGCAGLCGLTRKLSHRLGVPVLDGVVCGMIVAEGMANAGYLTSKVQFYAGKEPIAS